MKNDPECGTFELLGGPFDGQLMTLPIDTQSFIGAMTNRYACYVRCSSQMRLKYVNTACYIEDAMEAIEHFDEHQ